MSAPAELESLAVELAEGAAQVVRDGRRRTLVVAAKSTDTDLVTEVDRDTERWLVEQLARRRPADSVLGEEGGEHGTSSEGTEPGAVRWVLDPIDGTVNFVLDIPQYAVSVAAEVDGRVVAGAVCNPATGETFRAHLGGGAFLGRAGLPDERLSGPRDVPLGRAVVATGFGYDGERRARQVAVVAQLLPRIADIRRLGAAALDLCFLAAGRVDAYFEAGLNQWDYAAGGLVAAEAGCLTSGLRGAEASSRLFAACRPDLAPDFFATLEELGADGIL
jgi:myo-inositol-1(or 4)-monophosphatase